MLHQRKYTKIKLCNTGEPGKAPEHGEATRVAVATATARKNTDTTVKYLTPRAENGMSSSMAGLLSGTRPSTWHDTVKACGADFPYADFRGVLEEEQGGPQNSSRAHLFVVLASASAAQPSSCVFATTPLGPQLLDRGPGARDRHVLPGTRFGPIEILARIEP